MFRGRLLSGMQGFSLDGSSGLDKEQWQTIVQIQKQAIKIIHEGGRNDEEIRSKLEETLKTAPHIAETINLAHEFEMNLLQHSIKADLPITCSYLIKQGADLNSPMCNRPLHLAASLGKPHLMQMLLDFGSDPDLEACTGNTDLHFTERQAVPTFNADLLWRFSDPNSYDKPHTTLYYAIISDSPDCVKLLLDRGCTTGLSVDRYPPLHIACKEGKYEVAKYLICRDRQSVQVTDFQGYLPIHYAINEGLNFVKLLVQAGSPVMALTQRRETLLHLLFKNLNAQPFPLFPDLADCVEYLLTCGLNMNINIVDDTGNSALMCLLRHLPSLFKRDVLRRYRCLVKSEFINSVKLLLQAGCNPNICNTNGERALHILLGGSNPLIITHELLHLLLSHKANPNFCNALGYRPLWLLLISGFDVVFNPTWQTYFEDRSTSIDLLIECMSLIKRYSGNEGGEIAIQNLCGNPHVPRSLFYHLFSHIRKVRPEEHTQHDPETWSRECRSYMNSVMELTGALLQGGVTPMMQSARYAPYSSDLAYLYYSLITQSWYIPFHITSNLLTLMLTHGADPDIGGVTNPLSVLPRSTQRSTIAPVYPLLHLLHMYWKSSHSETDAEQSFELCCYSDQEILKLFHLFYNVTSPYISRRCLLSFINGDVPHLVKLQGGNINRHRQGLLDHLNILLTCPRTLQHQACLALYRHLQRKAVIFSQLPLPKSIIEKLQKFEF